MTVFELNHSSIEFPEAYSENAEYVSVQPDSISTENLKRLFQTKWCIKRPGLVISVLGSTNKCFGLPEDLKVSFRRGIIKAATSANAITLTDGLSGNIARHVAKLA